MDALAGQDRREASSPPEVSECQLKVEVGVPVRLLQEVVGGSGCQRGSYSRVWWNG